MKVKYRADDSIRELSDDAARILVDAGICDVAVEGDDEKTEPLSPAPAKGRKPR